MVRGAIVGSDPQAAPPAVLGDAESPDGAWPPAYDHDDDVIKRRWGQAGSNEEFQMRWA